VVDHACRAGRGRDRGRGREAAAPVRTQAQQNAHRVSASRLYETSNLPKAPVRLRKPKSNNAGSRREIAVADG